MRLMLSIGLMSLMMAGSESDDNWTGEKEMEIEIEMEMKTSHSYPDRIGL